MLDRGKGFVFQKNRLPLSTARSGAIGRQVVEFHVEQQQFFAGLIGHLNPFAAGGTVELDVEVAAIPKSSCAAGRRVLRAAHRLDQRPRNRSPGEKVGPPGQVGGEVERKLLVAGQGEAVAGELVIQARAAEVAVAPIQVPGELVVRERKLARLGGVLRAVCCSLPSAFSENEHPIVVTACRRGTGPWPEASARMVWPGVFAPVTGSK